MKEHLELIPVTNMAHCETTRLFTNRNGQILSIHLTSYRGLFKKKVSFCTKAESLERWPGRDMLDMYESDLLTEVHHRFCVKLSPD